MPDPIKPTHRAIQHYYERLKSISAQRVDHEMAVRSAFQQLLTDTAHARGWTFIPEVAKHSTVPGRASIRPDGVVRDENTLPRGYWEAKDSADSLDAEIAKKKSRGYPLNNIIFEDTREAVLIQNKNEVLRVDLQNPQKLADLLNEFYRHTEPEIEEFSHAVEYFGTRVPELARGLQDLIADAHASNRKFQEAFTAFFTLCQSSLNPNISQAAVDEMLIQHILTERLFRTIFDQAEFTRKNAIAAEVEKVIDALASRAFNRGEYLRGLNPFYRAIEDAARFAADFTEKQHFLNTVYERFFQGYSIRTADTHGIVYTPQPIVDFMCASVAEVLEKEFGLTLGSPGVNILDPCTGTGNFIVNLMRRIPKKDLKRVYKEQLFANEVMLMPYYIAALNIEHAYYELTGEYEPFEGLCFVDTLDMAEHQQGHFEFVTESNTKRVEREKDAKITLIIGNPPYNAWQEYQNDNNQNRKYKIIDDRVKLTYAKQSLATNKNALSDMYVKFFRWATDRLVPRSGVVCFVSNNSFVDQAPFDGMRKSIAECYTRVYHVDLHGNVRKNPKLSGTTHNVFGIQVGVGITVAVRDTKHRDPRIMYHRVPETWRRDEKCKYLAEAASVAGVEWTLLEPDGKYNWLLLENAYEFSSFLNLGSKRTKSGMDANAIFSTYSRGLETARDEWLYGFDAQDLEVKARRLTENYNSEVDRYNRGGRPPSLDSFVTNDVSVVQWCSKLKEMLRRGVHSKFSRANIRSAEYRPFTKVTTYLDSTLNHRLGIMPSAFPAGKEKSNALICCTNHSQIPFSVLATAVIPDVAIGGRPGQCFPFYIYNEEGANRRENITDWALDKFRKKYKNSTISKWDIFHYVYAILHHAGYREKFAENLKRELPRIPFAGGGV